MARKQLEHLSEDDIRTKIVHHWLKGCGITDNDIKIEFSINLRLGRGLKSIHSRTDILVKRSDGFNLLIIEVKKPSHELKDADKHQAISYARSLADGGIAPFTILTNGISTKIFDSVTGIDIGSTAIPPEHEVIKNNFKASGDSLTARTEALEYLISLSSDNLLAFCKGQVDHRMALLRGDNPLSDKKYIPQLYVNRAEAEKELNSKLFDATQNNDIVLVVGPPQHGKTCFICNTVEVFLKSNKPCLFYPAIALKDGLLKEIQEDFQWAFGENISHVQVVARLLRVLQNAAEPLMIVIDGWNEMSNQAILINNEIQRLENKMIKVVLSTTSPSLDRLLIDEADNLSFIATSTKLNASLMKRLSSEPIHNTNGLNIVQIGNFDFNELEEGKKRYGEIYNVKFTDGSNLPYDPFYLRIASEQYANKTVPLFATLTDLIGDSLARKGRRHGIQSIELFHVLNKVAAIILENDTPFASTHLSEDLSSYAKFVAWTEGGILLETHNAGIPYVDFYFTHDKNYAIAIIHRKWQNILLTADQEVVNCEMDLALKTVAGRTALGWFLSCPEYVNAFTVIFSTGSYFNTINPDHLKIFSDAIANQVNFNDNLSFDWLDTYINKLYTSIIDYSKNIDEITILVYSLVKSLDRNEQRENYRLWMRFLLKIDNSIEELGIEESYVHKVYGEEIKTYDGYDTFMDGDFDIELFDEFVFDDDIFIAGRAAVFLSYVCPYYFLERIPSVIKHHKKQKSQAEVIEIIDEPCERILGDLREKYFGGMCRGWFSDAEVGDEEVAEEFTKQKDFWFPISNYIKGDIELHTEITRLLSDLAELVVVDETLPAIPPEDSNQIKLDFS